MKCLSAALLTTLNVRFPHFLLSAYVLPQKKLNGF